MMIPSESWVARWQRTSMLFTLKLFNLLLIYYYKYLLIQCSYYFTAKFTPGMYAVAVHGNLPADYINDLASAGYKYQPRYPQT